MVLQDWYPKAIATINIRSTKPGKTTLTILSTELNFLGYITAPRFHFDITINNKNYKYRKENTKIFICYGVHDRIYFSLLKLFCHIKLAVTPCVVDLGGDFKEYQAIGIQYKSKCTIFKNPLTVKSKASIVDDWNFKYPNITTHNYVFKQALRNNNRDLKYCSYTDEISDISYVLNLPDTPAVDSSSGKENLGIYLGEI